jgi:iron complex outermembrane receptor protein
VRATEDLARSRAGDGPGARPDEARRKLREFKHEGEETMGIRSTRKLAFASVGLYCLAAAAAHGQAAPPAAAPAPGPGSRAPDATSIGEVVVTAQRKSERLQDVGIAVSAYSGAALKTQGVATSLDIAKFTPGLSISGTEGGQGEQFSIRGVTQADFNDAIEAPVAVYVDDAYISSQQGQGLAIYDVARVETLMGPQGTLFGRNATGGLVNFIVNKAVLSETSGYLDATYGTFDQTTLEGAFNQPLTDKLAVRLSGIWDRHGQIWKNVYPQGMVPGAPLSFGGPPVSPGGQSEGGEDQLAGRLQLLWKPTDTLQVRWVGSAYRENLSTSPWTSSAVVPEVNAQGNEIGEIYASPTETRAAIGPNGGNYFNPSVFPFLNFLYSPNNNGHRAPGATWFGYVPVSANDRDLSVNYARSDLNTFRAYNTTLHVDDDLGWAQLASVTAVSHYEKNFLLDITGSPVDGLVFATQSNITTYSQEFRLSGIAPSITWSTGLYYLYIDAKDTQGLIAPTDSALTAAFGTGPAGINVMSLYTLRTSSGSIFAQGSWEFLPKWTLVLGARGIDEEQHYNFFAGAFPNDNNYAINTSGLLFQTLPSFNNSRNELLWAGKAQVEYRPDHGLLVYLGINRGVKAGSYNAQVFAGVPPLTPSQIPYRPEELVSLEGGFKLTGPGGRYTLDASAFHYWYHNYQSFSFLNLSSFVQNLNASTNGVEVEGSLLVMKGLRVGAAGSYLDATVLDLPIAPGVFRNVQPTYTPKYSARTNVDYIAPFDLRGGQLDFGAVLSYQSSVYSNARNFAGERFNGRTLVDFNGTWSSPSGVSLSVFLKNAFDVRYKSVGLDFATTYGGNLEAYGMPRTAGVTLGYKF